MAGLMRGVIAVAIIALFIAGLGGPDMAQSGPPYVGVREEVSPKEIYYQGAGVPDEARLTLTLTALRAQRFPIDLILVVDRSATSDIPTVRMIGQAVLSRLGHDDRMGLVSFATEATLDVPLTSDRGAIREGLAALRNEGKTALGEGLAVANEELLSKGRPEAVLVELVLIDGRSNAGRDPLPQAWVAAHNGILIYTIGIGRYVLEGQLQEIAEVTGGVFYDEYSPEVLEEIFAQLPRDLVAREIVITKYFAPEVKLLRVEAGEAQVERRDSVVVLRLDSLPVGGSWSASFVVAYTARIEGHREVELESAASTVAFKDFRGQPVQFNLPVQRIRVRGPNQLPVAAFDFNPAAPTTQDVIQFTNRSYDPDGMIVECRWDFGDGTQSTECNPSHRYPDDGSYLVSLTVTDNEGASAYSSATVVVANVAPVASFTIDPPTPGLGQEVHFDASPSFDPDGRIVRYDWDLDGDGEYELQGVGAKVARIYEKSGNYQISLKVTDDDGAFAVATQTVQVIEPVAVTRTINTFLHVDKTLPDQDFEVTVRIEVKMDLHGLGLDEDLPAGWEVTLVENAGATYYAAENQWLFMEDLPAGTVKEVVYRVHVPKEAEVGIYDIKGSVSSASPKFEMHILGESQVEIAQCLPVSWVIARWDVQKDEFDIQLGDKISFEQIQLAVAWWLEQRPVPYTCNAVIDLQLMEELVAYWLTDTPVYAPLP